MHPEVDALGGGDHQVPGVVLAQAFHSEFTADGLKRFEDGWPVLRIAEPELFVFLGFQLILEDQVVRVNVFPAFSALGNRQLGWFWKRFHSHVGWPFRTSRTKRSWRRSRR